MVWWGRGALLVSEGAAYRMRVTRGQLSTCLPPPILIMIPFLICFMSHAMGTPWSPPLLTHRSSTPPLRLALHTLLAPHSAPTTPARPSLHPARRLHPQQQLQRCPSCGQGPQGRRAAPAPSARRTQEHRAPLRLRPLPLCACPGRLCGGRVLRAGARAQAEGRGGWAPAAEGGAQHRAWGGVRWDGLLWSQGCKGSTHPKWAASLGACPSCARQAPIPELATCSLTRAGWREWGRHPHLAAAARHGEHRLPAQVRGSYVPCMVAVAHALHINIGRATCDADAGGPGRSSPRLVWRVEPPERAHAGVLHPASAVSNCRCKAPALPSYPTSRAGGRGGASEWGGSTSPMACSM